MSSSGFATTPSSSETSAALCRRDGRPVDFAIDGAGAQAQAAKGARRDRGRLHPAAAGIWQAWQRQPRAGSDRNYHQPESARQGTQRSRALRCRSCRARSKAVTTSIRNCRTCANPARSSRTPTSCCSSTARNITLQNKEPQARHRRNMKNGNSKWSWPSAKPKSSSQSSATDRRAPSNCSSKGNTPASATLVEEINLPYRRDRESLFRTARLNRSAARRVK